jgi:sugar lactone lactonase YvrE
MVGIFSMITTRQRVCVVGLALTGLVTIHAFAGEATRIEVPGPTAYPESIAAAHDGTLYVGSLASGGIVAIRPGARKAEPFIAPGAFGSRSTFGLLVDDNTSLLWVCSNDVSGLGIAGPGDATGSHLIAFDVHSGEGKIDAAFPAGPALCNDLAIASDGSIYVTNSLAPQILRLPKGSNKLEVWHEDAQWTPPQQGPGLDGIAVGGDGNVYVNTYVKGELFRVDVIDGKADKVTKLSTSRPLVKADGLRTLSGTTFLMTEGGGSVDRVTVSGDTATIETLKDGLSDPTGVALVNGQLYITEGQLAHLFDAATKGPPALPFGVVVVPFKN